VVEINFCGSFFVRNKMQKNQGKLAEILKFFGKLKFCDVFLQKWGIFYRNSNKNGEIFLNLIFLFYRPQDLRQFSVPNLQNNNATKKTGNFFGAAEILTFFLKNFVKFRSLRKFPSKHNFFTKVSKTPLSTKLARNSHPAKTF
jgi:hypothetical protein